MFCSPFWTLSVVNEWRDITPVYHVEDSNVGVILGLKDNVLTLTIAGDIEPAIKHISYIQRTFARPSLTLMTQQIADALPTDIKEYLGPSFGWAWDFYYVNKPLNPVHSSHDVVEVALGSSRIASYRDEIFQVLEMSNPISDALDFFDSLSWFTIFSDDRIVAVLGYEEREGCAYLHGLGTHPDYRQHGYGGAVMVGAVNQLLKRNTSVQFGMWAWNNNARRLYRRLGITHGGALIHAQRQAFKELG
ncbi:GNAT family N-acetyltransferase [Arcanobacterium buesumense]|uniref:GNAT family N-acetyltransferase n=1 Tax=Arcanobacterium buesumense TaxID=2722751 RepID=A0A6H2EJK1_9ACTO|nr:GNAT family N-acetyltransferase [Arcanobacterium buesumense]QJC21745.1 GNAT family N-acetyltransferase [Arcanobacterium buesumense]